MKKDLFPDFEEAKKMAERSGLRVISKDELRKRKIMKALKLVIGVSCSLFGAYLAFESSGSILHSLIGLITGGLYIVYHYAGWDGVFVFIFVIMVIQSRASR